MNEIYIERNNSTLYPTKKVRFCLSIYRVYDGVVCRITITINTIIILFLSIFRSDDGCASVKNIF
jgi:hypothetical protein